MGSKVVFHLWLIENLGQAVESYDNIRPFYIYLYAWPSWVAPWSLFLIYGVYYFIKKYKEINSEEKLFLLASLIIFSYSLLHRQKETIIFCQ